jgi:hypothetical protein
LPQVLYSLGVNTVQVQLKTMKLVFVASLLSMNSKK